MVRLARAAAHRPLRRLARHLLGRPKLGRRALPRAARAAVGRAIGAAAGRHVHHAARVLGVVREAAVLGRRREQLEQPRLPRGRGGVGVGLAEAEAEGWLGRARTLSMCSCCSVPCICASERRAECSALSCSLCSISCCVSSAFTCVFIAAT